MNDLKTDTNKKTQRHSKYIPNLNSYSTGLVVLIEVILNKTDSQICFDFLVDRYRIWENNESERRFENRLNMFKSRVLDAGVFVIRFLSDNAHICSKQ